MTARHLTVPNMVRLFVSALLASLLCLVTAQSNTSASYTNPILDVVGAADPWVIRYDGYYYMTYTTSTNVTILKSSILTDWNNADAKLAFEPPIGQNYSTDLYDMPLRKTQSYRY